MQFSNVGDPNNILWTALAEKAYVQLGELNGSTNDDNSIAGGNPYYVISQITNLSVNQNFSTSGLTQAQVIADLNNHQIVTLGINDGTSNLNVGGLQIVNDHAYSISSYDATTNTFHLHNPWNRTKTLGKYGGYGDFNVSWSQLTSLGSAIWFDISVS